MEAIKKQWEVTPGKFRQLQKKLWNEEAGRLWSDVGRGVPSFHPTVGAHDRGIPSGTGGGEGKRRNVAGVMAFHSAVCCHKVLFG